MREVDAGLRGYIGEDNPAFWNFGRAEKQDAYRDTSHQPPATHFTALS
jgi:hypothetical protein